jgi:1-acyl-sn-glycerol-3-phosphate acyltransferase
VQTSLTQPQSAIRRKPRLLRAAHDCALFYSSLLVLGAICLSWTVIALPLYVLLPRRFGTAAGRYGIMAGFRIYTGWLTLVRAYRLDLRAIDALRGEPACILAPNHPCMIDALLILTRHPNIACVMKSEVLKNVFLGSGARLARYVCNEPPLQMIREAVADLQRGGVLLLFPEGTRSVRAPINALKASVGVIAKRAAVPVQTLLIETDSPYLGKGWSLLRRPPLPITYRVRLGRRFEPPEDVRAFMAQLEAYFHAELEGALQSHWLGTPPGSLPSSSGQ